MKSDERDPSARDPVYPSHVAPAAADRLVVVLAEPLDLGALLGLGRIAHGMPLAAERCRRPCVQRLGGYLGAWAIAPYMRDYMLPPVQLSMAFQ
jgi:hypothetical protein